MEGAEKYIVMQSEDTIRFCPISFTKDAIVGITNDSILGREWPVVYILFGKDEAYIGESCNVKRRLNEHLGNERRLSLNEAIIITDDTFNKSAILDLEQSLIRLFIADRKYSLQNENYGQSETHQYYMRHVYRNLIKRIWEGLGNRVNNQYDKLIQSSLYTYSPYTALTSEQDSIVDSILENICIHFSNDSNVNASCIVYGAAGTGKSLLAISIIFRLSLAMKQDSNYDFEFIDELGSHYSLRSICKSHGTGGRELKIGFLVPMENLRETFYEVFNLTPHLDRSYIIGPSDLKDKEFDVLLIDETHRLRQRKNLNNYAKYDEIDNKLRDAKLIGKNSDQLDWIFSRSKFRVFFFDPNQSVRGSDISKTSLEQRIKSEGYGFIYEATLKTQMRCAGGVDYINYLDDIFNCRCHSFLSTDYNFKFNIFNNVDDMINLIKQLDSKVGLCRNVAGFAWKWSHSSKVKDIRIEQYEYAWNSEQKGWILSKNAINEIGCVYSVQGFDLKYVGVILGPEIDYDPLTNSIHVDKKKVFDRKVTDNSGNDSSIVQNYVINAYKVLMTRGIYGCFVYACNANMRDYLSGLIKLMTTDEEMELLK